MGFVPGDVMYVALPLYHASAMCLALLNTLNVGEDGGVVVVVAVVYVVVVVGVWFY